MASRPGGGSTNGESGRAESRGERAGRLRAALLDREGPGADPAGILLSRAPGRVNLIGEHTDYNDGLVLPAAIDFEIWIAFRPIGEPVVELTSLSLGETRRVAFTDLAPRSGSGGGGWIEYVAGMAWSLREAGYPVRGFRGILDSNLPIGAGLSSSAALECASAYALRDPALPALPIPQLARLAQRAENAYVGVNCGIMDQFSSAAGGTDRAILLDCRSLAWELVPLPELALVVCNTGSPHRLETSQYNTRRAECEEGVAIIAAGKPSVRSLRDVDEATLEAFAPRMPENVARRCRHVVGEIERVRETVAALEANDLDALGRLFAASHASLRDLYEVSSPELDAMVEIAAGVEGVVASRMTGAGFGGCTVNLVRAGAVEALRAAVLAAYPGRTGLTPEVYVARAVEGAGLVD